MKTELTKLAFRTTAVLASRYHKTKWN